jgi:hypothetical protein
MNTKINLNKTRFKWAAQKLSDIHEVGAIKFNWKWLKANQLAVNTAYECGFTPSDPAIKFLLSVFCLRILNQMEPDATEINLNDRVSTKANFIGNVRATGRVIAIFAPEENGPIMYRVRFEDEKGRIDSDFPAKELTKEKI